MPTELKKTDDNRVNKPDYRQMCKYGKDCYQKNPMHREKFRHPDEDKESHDVIKKRLLESEESAPNASPTKIPKIDGDSPDGVSASKTSSEIPVPEDEKEIIEEDGELVPAFEDWPKNSKENIFQKYLVQMPLDFFAFWDFCKTMKRDNPLLALAETTDLRLVGPFELMPGSQVTFKTRKLNDFLCHWRYHYDPPEFQTVLASETSNFHIGYFRDSPSDEKPAFVASSTGEDGRLIQMGDNIFAAVYIYLGQLVPKADPFKQTAIQKLKQHLHIHATMKNQDESFSLEAKTSLMKAREKSKVCATFHCCGLIVPYNKKTEVGYRPIPETYPGLKKIFEKILEAEGKSEDEKNLAYDALQELITNVQFANDEGDPGMGVELGLNAFLYGGRPLHSAVRHLLTTGYNLLQREAFAKVINAHLNRRDGKVFKAK